MEKNLNVTTARREGPLVCMDRGRYKGSRVEDIIRKDPSYIMYCIKEWLDITPTQALVFEEITGGGIIPDRFIKTLTPVVESPKGGPGRYYWGNKDIIPDYDFDPSLAPEWWEEYKEKIKGMEDPDRIVELYEDYVRKDIRETLKVFYDEIPRKG